MPSIRLVTGAKQVAGAITASTLTTVSVFLPIVFLEGMTADIFKRNGVDDIRFAYSVASYSADICSDGGVPAA